MVENRRSVGGNSVGISPTSLASVNYSLSAIVWRCLHNHRSNRFGTITACDTDGRTGRRSHPLNRCRCMILSWCQQKRTSLSKVLGNVASKRRQWRIASRLVKVSLNSPSSLWPLLNMKQKQATVRGKCKWPISCLSCSKCHAVSGSSRLASR